MKVTDDPFERAAEREEREEMRRELARSWMSWPIGRYGRRSGTGMALRFFLLPYVVWGLLRAANHVWNDPTLPSSFARFFFGSVPFGIYTGLILFFLWVWVIERGQAIRHR